MEVLSRGARIRYEKEDYTIDSVIGIDDFHTIYSVHGKEGGGPRRILTIDDIDAVEKLDDDTSTLTVEKLYHYTLDWDEGIVREWNAYGVVLHSTNPKYPNNRYLVFSPYYLAMLPENKLGTVSTDYQMITKQPAIEEASYMIREAVIAKGLYFSGKVESYGELLDRLDGVEPEDTEF